MWQHVQLSEQVRPRDTLACCWDVKQPTNQTTSAQRSCVIRTHFDHNENSNNNNEDDDDDNDDDDFRIDSNDDDSNPNDNNDSDNDANDNCNDDNENSNDNDRIESRKSRFFTISSLRREVSPTPTP